jgi:hypothetical protein
MLNYNMFATMHLKFQNWNPIYCHLVKWTQCWWVIFYNFHLSLIHYCIQQISKQALHLQNKLKKKVHGKITFVMIHNIWKMWQNEMSYMHLF